MEVVRFASLAITNVQRYTADLLPLLRDAADSTTETVYIYFQLIYHMLRPLIHLILMIQTHLHPRLRPLLSATVSGFLSQPPRDIMLEIATATVMATFAWLEWKKGYARRLRQWVGLKSKVAGMLLPHLVYWGMLGVAWWVWPGFVRGLTNIVGVGSIAVIWPVMRTVWLVYAVEVGLDGTEDDVAQLDEGNIEHMARMKVTSLLGNNIRRLPFLVREKLKYWVVYGLVWGTRSVCHYWAPAALGSLFSNIDAILFYWFLWLQFPMTNGTRVIYEGLLLGMSRSYLRDGTRRARTERLNVGMRLLVACNILSEVNARITEDIIAESGLVLLGVIFFITPRFATFIGTVLVGCFFPAYLSTSSLVYEATNSQNNWLSYWAMYSLFDTAYNALSEVLGWVPLWYHAKLAIILWLQLPYYRGAAVMLERGVNAAAAAASDLSRTKITPRKRKRE